MASAATYVNALGGEFVWDDKTLFVQNYDLWQWGNLKQLLTSQDNLFGDRHTGFYRPLPNLSFLLDRYVWGQDPFGYHLTNLVFHVLCTVGLYAGIRQMARGRWPAFISALLFAVHPVHTEVVAWINGRNNLLSSLFYLVAFAGHVRYRTCGGLAVRIGSLIAFILSLLSKEYALTFPFVILLYESAFGPDRQSPCGRVKYLLVAVFPYLTAIVAYLAVRSAILPDYGAMDLQLESLPVRLLTLPKTVVIYLRLLVFPFPLSAWRHVDPVDRLVGFDFFFYTLLLFMLLFAWIWSFRKSKAAFFALGWMGATLLPVLNILPVSATGRLMAERYVYLPSVGWCLLCGWPFFEFLRSKVSASARWMRWAAIGAGLVLVQTYGLMTIQRNLVWRNDLTLWEDTASKSPSHFLPYANAAIQLERVGRLAEAEKRIRQALRYDPGNETLHFIHAHILFEMGRFAPSLQAVNRTLERDPDHLDAGKLKATIDDVLRGRGAGKEKKRAGKR